MISDGGLIPRRHALSRYLGILGGTAITAAAVALAGGMPVMAAAATAAASGGWSRPRELPAPRDLAEIAAFNALSCASRSDCTAVGWYQDQSSGRIRDFAATERRGVWGKALSIAAPTAGKNVDFGGLPVLSCASAGNCAAGDSYNSSGFVISETNGTWGKAQQVYSGPDAISCPAPGDCTAALAGGYLLSEEHGTWRKAFPVPGLAALSDRGIDSEVISCPSPGDCTAAGGYYDPAVVDRSFVVTERHGVWGNAQKVRNSRPGTGLNITALSCSSAGNCVAAGWAYPPDGYGAFAVTETHGRWGPAEFLPGTFNLGGGGGIDQLDCPAAGACTALGDLSVEQPFVSTEQNGTWHTAQTITGAGPSGGDIFDSISCAAAGNCVFAGDIPVRGGQQQAATAEQVNGRWGPATVLPGILAIDHGQDSALEAVSCPPRSRCTAVGSLTDGGPGYLLATVQR